MNQEQDATIQHRPYRFGDPDRTGWLLGLNGAQCVALGAAVFLAGLLLSSGKPFPVVLLPIGLGSVYAFARVGGVPAHEWLPVMAVILVRRSAGRTVWEAALPLLGTPRGGHAGHPDLPPCLRGVSVIDVASPTGDVNVIAVVKDDEDHTVSATFPVRGRAFSLLDPAEQDRLVAGWGDSLGGFCADGSPVAFVRWSEWAAPVGLAEHLRHLEARRSAPADAPAVDAYRELLNEAGATTVAHEVLVTVAVDTRRVRSSRRRTREGEDPTISVLLDEVRLLTQRLESAGLSAGPPLASGDLPAAVRLRLDPSCRTRLPEVRPSLAAQAGRVSIGHASPLRTIEHVGSFAADGSLHRAYLVAEWPRFDVPARWLEPLLLHVGGVRTVSVTCFPVPASRSARQVKRESTRLASDAELRQAKGFRVSARHRRSEAAVAEREAELASGFPELEHTGLVVVTAADADTLERSSAEWEQAAARAGLELRPLDGRHDLAVAAALPLGRRIPTRRLS
jgi:hypothetical protein